MKGVGVERIPDLLGAFRHVDGQVRDSVLNGALQDGWIHGAILPRGSPIPVWNSKRLCSSDICGLLYGLLVGDLLHDTVEDLFVQSEIRSVPSGKQYIAMGAVSSTSSCVEINSIPRHEGPAMDPRNLVVTLLVGL